MSPRLPLALSLTLSLALHAVLLAPDLFAQRARRPPPPPALLARLRPPPQPAPVLAAAEELLKNTLDAETKPALAQPAPPPAPKATRSEARNASSNEVRSAQRKLSRHLFYPPEAIERGLEGEVRLLVRLTDEGAVIDVSVAASSGHAILDNAAIRAAYAMGALPGGPRELILPVVFQLQ